MTEEDEKTAAVAIAWALSQSTFPKEKAWVIRDYESDPPPMSTRKLRKLFGSYNN